ncbi:uncharacterized protein DUF3793 [Ruminiclostridium sufflavum DSM 19573]|uniref:Uncharacterized protein DUF3793 n=1 Tax=Ruminiclostridium sufflavum DSM 19573 TaxID=1121337 RepID=A0A318XJU5_9FIRM|nr:DUF3793 family protein [Ruminiclostridium sufflavum]PYG86806.1 uncharacterized protein DUF3793 [Ruminiclostridium sufflavum DSM 19573]
MSEKMLVKYCAPTLAGIKTGNLFNCSYSCEEQLQNQINEFNKILNPKGVFITLLRKNAEKALIYVYRRNRLENDMSNVEVKEFLEGNGYIFDDTCSFISELSSRLCRSEAFPHEIGLFLGYPLHDVKAFIENSGKNCKCIGCWKVYSDEGEANKIFAKYKKCTDIYCKKHSQGLSIQRLTIAV